MESKPEVQQTSRGATRFSKTSVDVQEIIVINAQNEKLLQVNTRNKIRHKKAILCGGHSNILVKTLHMNHGGFQCYKALGR